MQATIEQALERLFQDVSLHEMRTFSDPGWDARAGLGSIRLVRWETDRQRVWFLAEPYTSGTCYLGLDEPRLWGDAIRLLPLKLRRRVYTWTGFAPKSLLFHRF